MKQIKNDILFLYNIIDILENDNQDNNIIEGLYELLQLKKDIYRSLKNISN